MSDPRSQVTGSEPLPLPNPLVKKRLSFADYFWSPDYQSGVHVLFDKLEQGVVENSQLLDFVSSRISLESTYASNLQSAVDSISGSRSNALGFGRDEGASTKQAFVSFLDESSLQSETHGRAAIVLEKSVRTPFAAFAANHKKKINSAKSSFTQITKNFNKTFQKTKKTKENYYSKASQLEELTNSSVPVIVTTPIQSSASSFSRSLANSKNFLSNTTKSTLSREKTASPPSVQIPSSDGQSNAASVPPQNSEASGKPVVKPDTQSSYPANSSAANIDKSTIIGGREYDKASLSKLLNGFWTNVRHETYKIPIIGSYENVSSGENILHYIRTTLGVSNLGFAEEYGQGLVDHGFLRLVGAIGNTFSGTSNSKYQWLPMAIFLAQMTDKPSAASSKSETPSVPSTRDSPAPTSVASDLGTRSSNPLASVSSTFAAAEESLDEAAAAMVKRTSSIVSGYFSNLLNNDENNDARQISSRNSQFSHRRQDSMPSFSDNKSSGDRTGLHSRTISMTGSNDSKNSSPPRRESQISKLQREIMELDIKYQEAVQILDDERCFMEQSIYEIFSSVQLCERERLQEVKNALSQFSAAIGASVPAMHQSIQRMGMHSDHIDPSNDLDYLIERYKTGPFCPKPIVYMGFFGNTRKQSFGVDLKYVPFIIDEFIKYIADEKHVLGSPKISHAQLEGSPKTPDSEVQGGDGVTDFPTVTDVDSKGKYVSNLTSTTSRDVLASLWTDSQSPLAEIQELRKAVNTGSPFIGDSIFPRYSLQVVISTLREILLELPNNIISYDAMKEMYSKQASAEKNLQRTIDDIRIMTEARINDFVRILSIFDREDLAALKVLIYHFADICEITNESSSLLSPPGTSGSKIPPPPIYLSDSDISIKVKNLSKAMAPYLVRPLVVTALTMTDKHPALVVQDLILYHEQVFAGIEARADRAHAARRRSRSASGSEANRRQNIEERNKAIVAAAFKNGAGSGMTSSLSMSKILALNTRPLSPAPSNHGSMANSVAGSAPNSPPRNGPLPLKLSSHIRSKNPSLGSNGDEELGGDTTLNIPPGYNGDGYNEGFGFPLSGIRSRNGSSTNLLPPQPRGHHRKSSSTGKRLSMSFLDPPLKSAKPANSSQKHASQSSIGSNGSVISTTSSHSSSNSHGYISKPVGSNLSADPILGTDDSSSVPEPPQLQNETGEVTVDDVDTYQN